MKSVYSVHPLRSGDRIRVRLLERRTWWWWWWRQEEIALSFGHADASGLDSCLLMMITWETLVYFCVSLLFVVILLLLLLLPLSSSLSSQHSAAFKPSAVKIAKVNKRALIIVNASLVPWTWKIGDQPRKLSLRCSWWWNNPVPPATPGWAQTEAGTCCSNDRLLSETQGPSSSSSSSPLLLIRNPLPPPWLW